MEDKSTLVDSGKTILPLIGSVIGTSIPILGLIGLYHREQYNIKYQI
jgi:hypothetical protein